ncbi:FG-GAP repeat protein [Haloarchaeobius sp. TZWWS8]|uniref:FG-GAP repeat protein n=1 Tax=Haloarchaeobius sp. TZWWS8 TaxID=3446121 RepID=UPI003EBAC31B
MRESQFPNSGDNIRADDDATTSRRSFLHAVSSVGAITGLGGVAGAGSTSAGGSTETGSANVVSNYNVDVRFRTCGRAIIHYRYDIPSLTVRYVGTDGQEHEVNVPRPLEEPTPGDLTLSPDTENDRLVLELESAVPGSSARLEAVRAVVDDGVYDYSQNPFRECKAPWKEIGELVEVDGLPVAVRGDASSLERDVVIRPDGTWFHGASTSYGGTLSLDGDTVLVSDQETAVLYERVGCSMEQVATLTPDDQDGFGDPYGHDVPVSLSGDTAIVGARDSAYIFECEDGEWTQQTKLTPPESNPNWQQSGFGISVKLDGDTALVGAPMYPQEENEDFPFISVAGAVAVFRRATDSWQLERKFDGHLSGSFDGSTAVLGSIYRDSVAVMERTSSGWVVGSRIGLPGGTVGAAVVDGDAALAVGSQAVRRPEEFREPAGGDDRSVFFLGRDFEGDFSFHGMFAGEDGPIGIDGDLAFVGDRVFLVPTE